jgi:hypothetical protein
MPLGDPQLFTVIHSNFLLDIDRVAAIISARIDETPDRYWWMTAEEVEAHKRAGGWPEYGDAGARMQGPNLTRTEIRLEMANALGT